MSATIGDGGIGKSMLVLTEAIAMVTGRNLLGIEPRRTKVLYWSGEEPIAEVQRRVAAICQHFKIDTAELEGRLFVATAADFPILIEPMKKPDTVKKARRYDEEGMFEAQKELFPDEVAALPHLWRFLWHHNDVDAVIIDPFIACHRVAENDNTAIDAVVKTWARFANTTIISVELVHHTRKPPYGVAGETSVDDARGASAFKDAVRSARALNRMTEAEGQRAGVENHRYYFRAENGKANYARPAEEATWFKMVPVLLPNGDQWHPGDEVGVVVPWHYPAVFDGVTETHMLKVRAMAGEGNYRIDMRSPDWIGQAVADVLCLDAEDDRARIKALLKVWFKNGVLRTVERRDASRRMKTFVEPGNFEGTGAQV